MKSHKYKAIIFDFDGVISESVDVKTKAFSKIYSCYGKDIVEKVVSHHMSHGGMSRYKKFKYYHKEFLDRELNKEDLINISDKFSQLVLQKVIDAPYVPGALNFIKNNTPYIVIHPASRWLFIGLPPFNRHCLFIKLI